MKLIKIKLCNFGIYENEHEIDFINKNNNQKLTLIVGKNGAGKTTLLNAIRVSFYGSLIFDVKLINSEYKNFIYESLNKNSLKEINTKFSIEITFISNILSSDGEYTIRREWAIYEDKFSERISIKKYQTELNEVDKDYFLGVLHQSYPIELFDLFFFDGEKIDKLSILNKDIVKVLETAFNLTLYKSLKSDLEKYAISKSISSELVNLEKEKYTLDNEIVNLEITLKKLRDEELTIKEKLFANKIIMQELSDSGFQNLSKFDDSEIKLAQKELDDLNKLHRTVITDFIPFTILQNEIARLIEQLNNENIFENNKTIVNELRSLSAKDLSSELTIVDEISINEVLNLLILKYEEKTYCNKIHNINNDEFNSIKDFAKKIENYTYLDYQKLQNEIIEKRRKIDILKTSAFQMQSDEYRVHINELIITQNNIAELKLNLESIKSQILLNEQEYKNKLEKQNQLAKLIWKQIKLSNIDNVLFKANIVLDNYINEVKNVKLLAIESQVLTMFNNILRKKDFIREIKLNDEGIKFIDNKGNSLSHSQLSAGERQIFTLSLLVSVLKTTQRITPLVFDTLLGRLDHDHKYELINNLLITAPNQIIILATDSEVDGEILKEIKPWINQVIYMDLYDKDSSISIGVNYEN